MTYANARLATPGEFDDLFNASMLTLSSPSLNSSEGFNTGGSLTISNRRNYDTSLRDALGTTDLAGDSAVMWTDPGGDSATSTTRDLLSFSPNFAKVIQSSSSPGIAHTAGFLLVSDAAPAAVPEPGTTMIMVLCSLGFCVQRFRKSRVPQTA